jgi:hypothetical protein
MLLHAVKHVFRDFFLRKRRIRFRKERPTFQCWRLSLDGCNVSVLGVALPINRQRGRAPDRLHSSQLVASMTRVL